MMTPARLRKISLEIGVAAACAIPFIPLIFNLLYPPKNPEVEPSIAGLESLAFNVLDGMSDGIIVMLWVAGFSAAAIVASLVAFASAWRSQASRHEKTVCLLPVLLVAIAIGILVAIGA